MRITRLGVLLLLAGWMIGRAAVEEKKHFIYLRVYDAVTLDPVRYNDFYSAEVMMNMYDGLVRFRGDSLEIEPALAERWQVDADGRRWRFHLRRHVRFHDGTPLEAGLVARLFRERLQTRDTARGFSSYFWPYIDKAEVQAPAPDVLDITLAQPYASFLQQLCSASSLITLPCDGGPFRPIGTGPFRLAGQQSGKSIVLVRNEEYWGGAPAIARLVMQTERDSRARMLLIRNGSVDAVTVMSAREYQELVGQSQITLLEHASMLVHFLGFNARRAPFNRLEVRQAFARLIDHQTASRQVFQSFGDPARSLLARQVFGFHPGKPLPMDLPLARRLLERAGYGDGFSCRLAIPEGQFGVEEYAMRLVVGARRVGIRIRVEKMLLGRLIQAVGNGDVDLFIIGWGSTADPGVLLNPMFLLSGGDGSSLLAAPPAYETLLYQAAAAMDDRNRAAIYARLQELLQEYVPLIPITHRRNVVVYNKRVDRLLVNPIGHVLFRLVRPAAKEKQ